MRRRRRWIAGSALLAIGLGIAMVGAPPSPAGEDGSGTTAGGGPGDWSYYVWSNPVPSTPVGDEEVYKEASVPPFAVHMKLSALRDHRNSGLIAGGIRAEGSAIVGLVVVKPDPRKAYSWTARGSIPITDLRAVVTCGERGKVGGSSVACASITVHGDLKMGRSGKVAARHLVGGSWTLSWPPSYEPSFDADTLDLKPEDKAQIVDDISAAGGDHHVQVLFHGSVSGDVLARAQPGLDLRFVHAQADLDAPVTVTLTGLTRDPIVPGKAAPPPMPYAEVTISDDEVTNTYKTPGGLLKKKPAPLERHTPPAPPEPDADDEDQAESTETGSDEDETD